MNITIVLRSPFLDRIPSLKTLITYLCRKDVKIKIISTVNPNFPHYDFKNNKNIIIKNVKERTNKFEIPTSIKLYAQLLKDIILNKSDLYIGCDEIGCKLILNLKNYIPLKFWNFLLEYPNLDNRKDLMNLSKAEKIITHDKWHSTFLNKEGSIPLDKFLYLPNSTHTPTFKKKSSFLYDNLDLKKDKIILLHSGGFGPWFMCREVIDFSKYLPNNAIIVFHASHNITNNDYYKNILSKFDIKNLPISFSLQPVTDEKLDELISSATIGLAFYSLKELGYRAEYMGLAAGKIGNYLKCGVPVIATNVSSLKYIEDYKCGILIDSFDQIPNAILMINNNLKEYKDNAYKCYDELWKPDKFLMNILSELKKKYNQQSPSSRLKGFSPS